MRVGRPAVAFVLLVACAAFTAAPASAAEIVEERDGQHCYTEACEIHFNASGVEFGSPLGMIVCNLEFRISMDEDGAGINYPNPAFTGCSPITVTACSSLWLLQVFSDIAAEFSFCYRVANLNFNCHVGLTVFEPSAHHYLFSTSGSHRNCEQAGLSVQGTFHTEASSGFEIVYF
jgi:hypothetical protein